MKKILLLSVFTILLLLNLNASENYSFEKDKQQHFILSSIFAVGSESILETYNQSSLTKDEQFNGIQLITYATLTGIIPGLAKELIDEHEEGNELSKADLAYDFAGALLGSTLSYSIHRAFDNNNYHINLTLKDKHEKLYISYRF